MGLRVSIYIGNVERLLAGIFRDISARSSGVNLECFSKKKNQEKLGSLTVFKLFLIKTVYEMNLSRVKTLHVP